jgi:hypothetical protein
VFVDTLGEGLVLPFSAAVVSAAAVEVGASDPTQRVLASFPVHILEREDIWKDAAI